MLRLKKIELNGFKSFAEPITIEVEENLLGIVGPNGSGKSNILDAIHCVFGEQKPSIMRVSKIADLIFNGTQTHPAVGACRVNLTFEYVNREEARKAVKSQTEETLEIADVDFALIDELDEALAYASSPPGSALMEMTISDEASLPHDEEAVDPVELTPGCELTISRSVYRDGTSEYFLNGKKTSLSVIDKFFAKFQLGRLATFSINQGEVERKLLSSPTEIREWLGEASGVAILLRAKASCERKLDRTEQNLTRVRDILATLKDEVESLKFQAENAIKAQYLKNLEWQIQARLLGSKLSLSLKRLEKAEYERNNFKERAFNLAVSMESLKSESDETEEKLTELEREEKILEDKSKGLRDEETRRMIDASILSEKEKSLREKLAEIAERIKTEKAELEKLKYDLNMNVKELVASEDELRKLTGEEEEINAELSRLKATLAFSVDEMNELADNLGESERELAVYLERARSLEAERDNLSERLQQLINYEAENSEALEVIRKNVKELMEAQKTQNLSLSEEEKKIGRVKDELEKKRKELLQLEQMRADLREKLSALRTAHENYDELRAEFYRIEQELPESLLVTPLLDLIAFSREWSQAVASALGEAAEGFVTEESLEKVESSSGSGVFIIPEPSVEDKGKLSHSDVIETKEEERASHSHVVYESLWDKIHGRQEVINALRRGLGEFAICDDTKSGWKLLAECKEVSAVVIRGKSMILRRGLIKKGASPKGSALFAKHSELPVIKDEIDKLEQKVTELRERINQVKREEQRLSAEIVVSEKTVRNLQSLLIETKTRISGLTSRDTTISEQVERTSKEKKEVEERLAVVVNELNEVASEMEIAQAKRDRLLKEKLSAESSLKEQREKLSEIELKYKNVSDSRVQLALKVDALLSEISKFREKLTEVNENVENLELQYKESESELAKVLSDVENASQRVNEVIREREEKEFELAKLREKEEELVEQREKLRRELSAVEESLKKFSGGTSEIDEHLWQAKQNFSEAVKEIHQRLGVSIRSMYNSLRKDFCAPAIQPSDFFPTTAEEKALEEGVQEGSAYPLVYYDETSENKMKEELLRVQKALQNLGDVNPFAPKSYQEKKDYYDFLAREREELTLTLKELRALIRSLDEKTKDRFVRSLKQIEAKFNELFVRLFGGGFARFRLTEPEDVTASGIEVEVQLPGGRRQNIRALSGGERSLLFIALFLAVHITRPGSFCVLDEVDAALDDLNVARFTRLIQELAQNEQFIVITHNNRTMRVMERLIGVVHQPRGVSKIIDVSLKQAEAYADRGAA